MASQFYIKSKKGSATSAALLCRSAMEARALDLGPQPFNRDDTVLAFGRHARIQNGQKLAGTGALVFEGEVLELPAWN